MPLYRYQATNEQGEHVGGTVDATDEATARTALDDAHMTGILLEVDSSTSIPASMPSPLPIKEKSKLDDISSASKQETHQNQGTLIDTLRLYAGWLLAWYGLVMTLGYYSHARTLSFEIPFVEGLFLSSLVFSFLLATFLFLLITSLLRLLKGGLITGSLLGIAGIGLFYVIKASIG